MTKMAMTITQKILADHADLGEVYPGQLINARVDIVMGNDITAPIAIEQFKRAGAKRVFDKGKVVLVPDHFVPNKDIKSAEQCKILREFAREQGLTYYFELGEMGIEHALLPDKGIVLPGDLVVGADSHTCTYGALGAFSTGVGSTDFAAAMITGELWFKVPETIKLIYRGRLRPWVSGKDLILYTIGRIGVDGALYKAMEFVGETIDHLSMPGRFTMANMAIEAGAKNGIFVPDRTTEEYVKARAKRVYLFYKGDEDARYSEILEFDASKIEPQVAFPHIPSNTKGISEVGEVFIDQAVIGSCTNGRIDDLREAAKVLKGHRISSNVRLIIIPATPSIYRQAMQEGLFEIFLDAGAVISPPTCGPCLGGYMGVLAKGEKAIATTNRNFVGRMGHPESEVYLSNPAVAAASAVLGRIGGPEELGPRD
jgi:3-isopropylmalate/(R)-2-methylmalate dehydratase large subunit